jgi:hypothetical protein
MRVLFEATTVAALAARVEQTRAEAGEAASDPDAEDTVPAQATIPRLART